MGTKLSLRQAYGEEIVALGSIDPNVVALEADLGKSTMSCLFQQEFPERYFEMGISEQDMLSTAAGLAASGKIPFCSTFAVFATGRAYDQIRQTIAIGMLNVKICGSSAGLSDFGDGATHQSIDDIAIMSAIPNMTVLTPCDAVETRKAVRAAYAADGPVYIRVSRSELPIYTGESDAFEVGKLRVLKRGKDIALIAHGNMVSRMMEAAEQLARDGVSACVVNVGTIKPFDEEGLCAIALDTGAILTAEDHNHIGGLASNCALALRGIGVPMDFLSVRDQFGQSAHSIDELLTYYGLSVGDVVRKAKGLILQKEQRHRVLGIV